MAENQDWTPEVMEGHATAVENEKRALLAFIAEQGMEGQAEWERSRELMNADRNNDLETAAARGAAIHQPKALQSELERDYDAMLEAVRNELGYGSLAHGREMDRIAASAEAYYDSMKSAVPLYSERLKNMLDGLRGGGGGGGGYGGGGYGGGSSGGDPFGFGEGIDPMSVMPLHEASEGYATGIPYGGTHIDPVTGETISDLYKNPAVGIAQQAVFEAITPDMDPEEAMNIVEMAVAAAVEGDPDFQVTYVDPETGEQTTVQHTIDNSRGGALAIEQALKAQVMDYLFPDGPPEEMVKEHIWVRDSDGNPVDPRVNRTGDGTGAPAWLRERNMEDITDEDLPDHLTGRLEEEAALTERGYQEGLGKRTRGSDPNDMYDNDAWGAVWNPTEQEVVPEGEQSFNVSGWYQRMQEIAAEAQRKAFLEAIEQQRAALMSRNKMLASGNPLRGDNGLSAERNAYLAALAEEHRRRAQQAAAANSQVQAMSPGQKLRHLG